MKHENLLDKKVEITDKKSQYCGYWGYIKFWDGDHLSCWRWIDFTWWWHLHYLR